MFSRLTKRFGLISKAETETKPAPEPTTASETGQAPAEETASSFKIEANAILINQKVESRKDALALIASKMLEKGYVSSDYLDALEAREQAVSTYLMNGIAIPHGVNEAKSLVTNTGVVIIQIPQGVVWNDKGDRVFLAVGIAAVGNEHNEVLKKLTAVVMDEALATHLGTDADAGTIAAALGQSLPTKPAEALVTEFDASTSCVVVDEAGLHARPATLLVQIAEEFAGTDIWLSKGDLQAKMASMTRLLSLGIVHGDSVVVSASGPRAEEAVDQIADAISKGLDPVESSDKGNNDYQPLDELLELTNPNGRILLKGIPASPGIALAEAFILDSATEFHIGKKGAGATHERSLLDAALSEAHAQLLAVKEDVAARSPAEAVIFLAQAELLKDNNILTEAQKHLDDGSSAAWAWQQTIDREASIMEDSAAERIRARAADLLDVGRRVITILQGGRTELEWPDRPFVLISKELTPSQTAELSNKPVRAICTELGGATSHMAILARALGLPALVGIGSGLLSSVKAGEAVAVAPQSDLLILSPDEDTSQQVEDCIHQWHRVQEREFASKDEPAITRDGAEIEVVCNISSAADADKVSQNGGSGVGLLRTEFLFETAKAEPDVETQVVELAKIAKTIGNKTLIVRTSDIGGDKPVSWLKQPTEDNPFLGVRGIRLSLRHTDIFKRQLEAIYRVAKAQAEELGSTGIHIMFPMISALNEFMQAKEIAEEVRQAMGAPELPLGMMIEVPSAALLAEHFAKEADFFSIGTNDLTQYTLAMDRMNPDLLMPQDNYSPALLHMIAMTTMAANAAGKWVGVCGNLVAEPDFAKILIGLGVKELSVSPVNVPALKELVRSVERSQLEGLVQKALEAGTPEEVKQIIRNTDQ